MRTDAPERILCIEDRKFGWPHGYTDASPAIPDDDRNPVEYVRADILAALKAEIKELEAALDSQHAAVGSNIWRFWRDQARHYAQLSGNNRIGMNAETARADRAEAELEALRRDYASLKDAQTDAINALRRAVAGAYQAAADRIGQPDIDLEDVTGTQKAILALTGDDAREAEARVIQEAVAAALMEAKSVVAALYQNSHSVGYEEGWDDAIDHAEQAVEALIDTDALARLEERETAIQQQAYQKGYGDGARAEYESNALAAIRKGET